MELLCTVYPVTDLESTLDTYRAIGFQDIARPDEDAALLAGGESGKAEVLLIRHPGEAKAKAGPVFRVASVEEFHAEHPGLRWLMEPMEIPTGRYAMFTDPEGNTVRIMDFSLDNGRYLRLFQKGLPLASG